MLKEYRALIEIKEQLALDYHRLRIEKNLIEEESEEDFDVIETNEEVLINEKVEDY